MDKKEKNVKIKLLKQLLLKIKQTNLNRNSKINIPLREIWSTIKCILLIDSDLLENFYIIPMINCSILFDYNNKNNNSYCLFNFYGKRYSFVAGRNLSYMGPDISENKIVFSISSLKNNLIKFKNLQNYERYNV